MVWFKANLFMALLSLPQSRKMPFFRLSQQKQALSNKQSTGFRLEGEKEGGNSYELHKKWWQSPPVLKME